MIKKTQMKIKEYFEQIQLQFFEILKSEKSDHSVALGFSIGSVICILPTPGLNIILVILAGIIFKGLNKAALAISLLFWNPITMLLVYFLSFKIGALFYTSESVSKFNVVILNQIYDYSMRYLLGNVIITVVFSVLGYFLIRLVLLINRKFVKKEFAEINYEAIESKEKEEKIEHHDTKIDINVVHHGHSQHDSNHHLEHPKIHGHLKDTNYESHHIEHHENRNDDFVDLSKLHDDADDRNKKK